MTSQIWSRIEYLIPTCYILVLVLTKLLTQNPVSLAGFNKIYGYYMWHELSWNSLHSSVARPTSAGWPKKLAHFVLDALTSSDTDPFSNLFHRQNQDKICNNTLTKDPTTPQVCHYTTL